MTDPEEDMKMEGLPERTTGPAATEKEPLPPTSKLAELLQLVSLVEGPDPWLDGALDGLVGHEGEQWPAPYTREVMHLQRITPRLGLDVRDVSADAMAGMSKHPWRPVALIYAEALLRRLIALADAARSASPRQADDASPGGPLPTPLRRDQ